MMNIKGTSELFSLCPSMSTSKVRARAPAASVQLCSESVPQTRIEELKQQYSGEQCPVSANEIAGAMLHQIGGLML